MSSGVFTASHCENRVSATRGRMHRCSENPLAALGTETMEEDHVREGPNN